jgi:hypothetical protein
MRTQIRIQPFTLMGIRILLLVKLIKTASTDPPQLHLEPPRLHCDCPTALNGFILSLKPLKFKFDPDSTFYSNADLDPAFRSDTDWDPASQNDAAQCGSDPQRGFYVNAIFLLPMLKCQY